MDDEPLLENDIIILRCCRDWPVHVHSAYGNMGKCGICKKVPTLVAERYPLEKYARVTRGKNKSCNE